LRESLWRQFAGATVAQLRVSAQAAKDSSTQPAQSAASIKILGGMFPARVSLCFLLDFIAGPFHVLAETVGGVAARADEGEQRGEAEQGAETFE
jgi:hypothetical protein